MERRIHISAAPELLSDIPALPYSNIRWSSVLCSALRDIQICTTLYLLFTFTLLYACSRAAHLSPAAAAANVRPAAQYQDSPARETSAVTCGVFSVSTGRQLWAQELKGLCTGI